MMLFWKNMRMASKISFGFFIVLILTTVVGIIGWNGMHNIVNSVENADDANRIIKRILEVRIDEKNYLIRKDDVYVENVYKLLDEIIIISRDLISKLKVANDKKQIESIITAVEVYRNAFKQYKELELEYDHTSADEIMVQAAKKVLGISDEIRENQKAKMESGMNIAINLLVIITAAAVSLGALMALVITISITAPVRRFVEAAGEISKGNYSTILKLNQKDEIGFLAESFNKMTDKLIDVREKLESRVKDRTFELEKEVEAHRKADEDKRILTYAIEQSPSIVIIKDMDQRIEYVNPKFMQISDYSLEEVIGKKLEFLNAGDFPFEKRKEMMNKVLNDQIQRTEFHNKKKNGEEYWVSASISGIKDENGVLTNILEVQEDITLKKKLREQLLQAQKLEAIGTLAGGVAHDFNNILSVVLGYSEYLLSKLDKEDKIYSIMEDIREASNRGASLTGQLLAFSRKQAIQISPLNLNNILRGIEKMLNRLMAENVKLSLNLERDLWAIEADQGQMDQILLNMAVNSSHAMPEGGYLIISSANIDFEISDIKLNPRSRAGKFVSLSIKDTGCGMDGATISRIFDPFFSTKPMGKGTGLGLSVVYGIVEQHKGWINVNSEPGKGTEFRIFLPALEKQKQVKSEVEIKSSRVMGNGERILLVEDDKVLRDFAVRVLTENGYIVFSATEVTEVFDMFDVFDVESGNFDLVFSDVMLPDIDGVKLVEFLLERNVELKVLLTSGYTDEKSHWAHIQKKGYSFMQKPYTMETLLNKIDEVLGKS